MEENYNVEEIAAVNDIAAQENIQEKNKMGISVRKMADSVAEKAGIVAKKSTEAIDKTKETIFQTVDVNGDGQIDIEDVILMAFKVPGVSINREKFLRQELITRYSPETVEQAVLTTPMKAQIRQDDINNIATAIIQNERLKVSGISAALGTPGGAAMVATIPADIAQYYGCMLRVAQKLLYLYGFPQIEYKENEQAFDTETMNQIILCMGVMFGVANAKNGLLAIAKALGTGVEKQLVKKALTKGTIYPIVKSVSKWFGIKMTKEVFAGFFKKAIPIVGGVVGGGLTYATFKPCCVKLKTVLEDTYLSNPQYKEKEDIIDIKSEIEAECIDVENDNLLEDSENVDM